MHFHWSQTFIYCICIFINRRVQTIWIKTFYLEVVIQFYLRFFPGGFIGGNRAPDFKWGGKRWKRKTFNPLGKYCGTFLWGQLTKTEEEFDRKMIGQKINSLLTIQIVFTVYIIDKKNWKSMVWNVFPKIFDGKL